jgi:PAS domain S-box-containing protein
MSTKRYTEVELRALIGAFDNPMLVLHEERVRMANDAYVRLLGLSREQVEGRSFLDFTTPTERSRLAERYQRVSAAGVLSPHSLHHLLPNVDGSVHEVTVRTKAVELEGLGHVVLVNCVEAANRPQELSIAERLVETSAALVTAHSEEAVRRLTREGLEAAGFQVRFLKWDGERLSPDGAPLPEDVVLAHEALADGHPVFGGATDSEPSHVYLPVGAAPPEVLCVEGPGLAPTHGSVLTLFAKAVGAALADARLLSETARGKWEVEAVAEVARFVAQPVPPTPESFLARVADLFDARVAVLQVLESSGGVRAPVIHVGPELPPGLELARLTRGLVEAVAGAEGGVLTGEAEERALREASGGRLGQGAAARLQRGGEVLGTLHVLRAPGRPFDARDVRLLGTLAELLVTLLEQHRLRAESARQLSETRLLLDLARTTSGVLDSASILDVAADFLVRLLDVTNCFILLYDEQAKVLRGAASSAVHRDYVRSLALPLGSESLAARVARERRPVAIEDVARARGGFSQELAQRFGEKALLGLPLTSREELIGVVLVDDTRGPRTFGPAFIELAQATCGQLALSIANARLYESLWASYAELAATRAEMVKRERLAALGELSAIVAHEVRNPLGVIFNAVSSLRRILKPEGDAAMLLDILGEESDRLNRMVGDLLDYTRPRDPLLQPEDVGRVVQDALEAARAQGGATDRPVQLQLEVEPHLPPVPMDRRLIHRALVNVAVNAIQAMPGGGRVQVRARRESHAGKEHLRIDVVDQGPGIPSELLHRVFEPFFTTKAQGTGLGLAVVKRILEEHRGEIAVDSTPGRGTTFTFRLPLTQP